jgi:hypothetical protein
MPSSNIASVVASSSMRSASAGTFWHAEATLREALVIKDEAVAIPNEDLHAIETPTEEDEEVAVEGIEAPRAAHDRDQAVMATA